MSYHRLSNSFRAYTTNISFVKIPKSIHDALVVLKWRETFIEEMRALEVNGTWDLVREDTSRMQVGTIKYKSDGLVEGYKARL